MSFDWFLALGWPVWFGAGLVVGWVALPEPAWAKAIWSKITGK